MSSRLRYGAGVFAIAGTYVAIGVVTLSLHRATGVSTLLWAPGAFAFGIALAYGLRWWPGIAIGTFCLLTLRGVPLVPCLVLTTNDVLEVAIGTLALISLLRFRVELDRVRDVVAFVGVSVAISFFVASANVAVLLLTNQTWEQNVVAPWWHWWWANLCGDLIITPAVLTFAHRARPPAQRSWRRVELFTLAVAGAALVLVAVWTPVLQWLPSSPYYLLPMLVWAGVRFGPRGAALASLGASLAAIAMHTLGVGVFDRLLDLQSFVAITTISTLLLSALVLERQSAIELRGAIQTHALDAIISIDARGRILELNPAAEAMFQIRGQDIIGADIAVVAVPPRLRDKFREAFRSYTRTVAPEGCRYRTSAWRAVDHDEFPVEIAVAPIAAVDHTMFTAFVRDISHEQTAEIVMRNAHDALEREVNKQTAELRAANLALEQRGTLMRQAEELASIGSFEFELSTHTLKWSDELYRIYGRDPASYTPSYDGFIAAIHPDDRDAVQLSVARAIECLEPFSFLERVVRPDGSVRVLQTLARVTLDGEGRPLHLVGCCQDVTAREAAERVRSRLVQLVESSDDAMIGLTTSGLIETWNPAATRLFGYEAIEAIGQPVTMLVPDDLQPRLFDLFEAVRAGEHVSHYEMDHCRKDKMRIPCSVTTSALVDSRGEVVGMSKVIRDITNQKRAELEIRASLREKEVLLREIHHRVKNNLQVIASLLNIQMASDSSPEASKGLIESQNRIQSMALVHQLLYQSKDLAQIDFGEYLSKLAARLRDTYDIGSNQIAIEVVAQPLRLDVDHAIPCGLIVNELVTNALTHAFPDDRRGTVRITVQITGSNVSLLVVDDGIGIAKDLEIGAGHTFGLRIARTLSQQLDGTISVTREPTGTRAELTFPVPLPTRASQELIRERDQLVGQERLA